MKKRILFALMLALAAMASAVSAETAANLRTKREYYNSSTLKKVSKITFIDSLGNPVVAEDKGYASISYRYSPKGDLTRIEYQDVDGNLVNCSDGYAMKSLKYSSKRKLTDINYYDARRKPVCGPEGYASRLYYYEGNVLLSITTQDEKGKKTDGNDGFSDYKTKYHRLQNKHVRVDEGYYLNANGEEVAGPEGYARVENTYYEKEKLIKTAYYDADGNLFFMESEGYAFMEKTMWKSRVTRLAYYDQEGLPVNGPEGYAWVDYVYYDEEGVLRSRPQRQTYYDENGAPVKIDGAYAVHQEFMEDDKIVGETYYDEYGERGYCDYGYSRYQDDLITYGRVGARTYYDENDQPMIVPGLGYATVKYSYTGKYNRYVSSSVYLDTEGNRVDGTEGYCETSYVYDKNNKLVGQSFLSADGTPVVTSDGYARIEYENDANGNHIKTRYIGEDGNPVQTRNGYDEVRNTYTGKKKTEETYYADGQPVLCTQGYFCITYEYNADDKVLTQSYFDTEMQPVLCNSGYASLVNEYDEDGELISTRYYDTEGNLATRGKEYASTRKVYDEDHMGYTLLYLDGAGSPITLSAGYDSLRCLLNEKKQVISETKMLSGVPVATDGYATTQKAYNEKGRVISERYFAVDGTPALCTSGYAGLDREYDGNNCVVAESYVGTDGQPCANTSGYAALSRTYTGKNLVQSEAYYDAKGNLTENNKGIAFVQYEYDLYGNRVGEAYYNVYGRPCANKQGYAAVQRVCDARKLVLAEAYYGTDGNPVALSSGYAAVQKEYNDLRQTVREMWFGTDGEPTMNTSYGAYGAEYAYDEAGNQNMQRYLDAEGNPTAGKNGYAEVHKQLNAAKKVIREAYYGLDGKPVARTDTYACATEYEYDEAGNQSVVRYYGADNKPVLNKTGSAEIHKTYNANGKVAREEYFGADGKPAPRTDNNAYATEYEYDEAGNQSVLRYYGEDGLPCLNKTGCAEVHKTFNENKKVIREEYFGADGKPTARTDNNAYAIEYEYDEAGNQSVLRYYGEDGLPVLNKAGYAEIHKTYNADKKVIREAYFGPDGEPTVRTDRNAYAAGYEYDEAGNQAVQRFYDTDGKMMLTKQGYAEIHRTYNAQKKIVHESYYGTDGKPIALSSGAVAADYEYDEAGNKTVTILYDAAGNVIKK